MGPKVFLLLFFVECILCGRRLKPRTETVNRLRRDFGRQGRQLEVTGGAGIDFSNAVFDEETGKRCVIKEEEVESIEKAPVLECVHKDTEQCHYTYITTFKPSQEEVCEENFEKSCQVTFKQQAFNETVKKCYRPVEKVCNGEGPELCQTIFETSCSTKYKEKQPGKFVGDTSCEKLPVEICGAGCTFQEGPEECHQKVIASLVDVPEEVCDLNPQKTCRFQTKLVPRLVPKHECTIVPRETCHLKFRQPKFIRKPLLTKWCLDDSPVVPGELYDEGAREEQRSIQGRPLPLANTQNDLGGPRDSKITIQSLELPSTDPESINIFEQNTGSGFSNEISNELPLEITKEDQNEITILQEPVQLRNQLVENLLPIEVDNPLPNVIPNQLPLQNNELSIQAEEIPAEQSDIFTLPIDDDDDAPFLLPIEDDQQVLPPVEDDSAFLLPIQDDEAFLLPVDNNEDFLNIVPEVTITPDNEFIFQTEDGGDAVTAGNLNAGLEIAATEQNADGAEADFFTARPISILSSGNNDQQFVANFKTQEFEDFIDFSVYRI